jgi:OOP family OmpA-OmpF porin
MMTKVLTQITAIAAASLLAASAPAVVPGFYLGAQVGQNNTSYTTSTAGLTSTTGTSTKGAGARFYGGYQFDQNWAAELGYSAIPNATFNGMNTTANNGSINHSAWTFLGKGIMPLNNGFELFAKAGLASSSAKPDANLRAVSTIYTGNKSATSFAWGVGAAYDINCNMAVDLSFHRIQGKNNIRNNDLFAIGASYNFG